MSVSRLLRDTCLAASFKRDSEPWKGFREDVASTEKEYCHEFVFKYTKKWGGGCGKGAKIYTYIVNGTHIRPHEEFIWKTGGDVYAF